jgi:cephalosporin hydroxylase
MICCIFAYFNKGIKMNLMYMGDWISQILTAWGGHRKFAEWLVSELHPTVVVDLGVDYGFSTFCFANALKGSSGKVYGIDLFEIAHWCQFRDRHQLVQDLITKHAVTNIEIIKNDFNEVIKSWDKEINILHIDGWHDYDNVKNDFTKWSKLVKDDGIIIMHDTEAFRDSVGRFFGEIEGYYKLNFPHSCGLGVVTKNKELYDRILSLYSSFIC